MKELQKQCGLSMIGLIIAMIVVGALLAGLAPMFLSKHIQSKRGADLHALEAARTALASYALSIGRLPSPVDASNTPVIGAGLMPPSAGSGTGVVPALGVNNWGEFGRENPFRLDVNTALINTTSPLLLCQAAQAQLHALVPPLPQVCQDTASVNPICGSAAPMAFVLYSTGEDHKPNLKNAATNRIYESDNRGIDNTADATNHYDDELLSYPLSGLVGDCVKAGLLPPPPVCKPIANPATIAAGGSSTLTANCSNSPTSYSWTPATLTPNSTGASGSVTPAATTTYSVTATNASGPSAPATVTVTVLTAAVPICTISPVSATLPLNATAQLFTATCSNPVITNYAWTVDGVPYGLSASSITTLTNLVAGVHPVTVIATNAAGPGPVATASLTVKPCAALNTHLTVTNSSNGLASFRINAAACTAGNTNIAVGATVNAGCMADATTVTVYNSKNCTGTGFNFSPNTLSGLDTSGDGEAHITILQPASSSTYQ